MNRFISLLFTVILFELMLGGGGRLVNWGPVSLRMILFVIAFVVVCIQILRRKKLPRDYWLLSIFFACLLLIGVSRGIVMGASRVFWWEDIKPLLYFLILPFFGFAVQAGTRAEIAASIIKRSGIILSSFFIIVLVLIHTGAIPFLDFYDTVIGTQEFFFRGELTFFYKGFIFICIAFLFVYFSEQPYKHLILILLGIGILLSVTRGFLFAFLLTYAFYYFLKSSFIRFALFAILSLAIVLAGQVVIRESSKAIDQLKNRSTVSQEVPIHPDSNLLGDRNYSDDGRFQQIKEVTEQINLSSIILGHGFGMGIPSRPIHMEISYLEIFHKQGIVGLAFWAYLLWLLYKKYKVATPGGLSDAFFFGSSFVYFQSLTNQYINNPIGLSMVILSIVCLDQLKKD